MCTYAQVLSITDSGASKGQVLAFPVLPRGETNPKCFKLPAQVRFHKALLSPYLSLVLTAPRKNTGKEEREEGKGVFVRCTALVKGGWRDAKTRRGPAPLEGELADVVEAPLAVVVPPGAVVRGLRHAVLQRAAVGLIGAERVWRGAGLGAGLRPGRLVPGEEGHALAVLEEVEALGAPVVHAQPHRPVVGSQRRTQVASERFHLLAVRRLCQASAPRHAPRLRRRLRLEVAREQEALVAKAQPLQAACGWGGVRSREGGVRTSRGGEKEG